MKLSLRHVASTLPCGLTACSIGIGSGWVYTLESPVFHGLGAHGSQLQACG